MKKRLKVVLVGLFILSMNLFGITIDTRNPDITFEKNDKNIIWTMGSPFQDAHKDFWREELDENESWVSPYMILYGLNFISQIKYKSGKEYFSKGDLGEVLTNAEYDFYEKSDYELTAVSSAYPGKRFKRTVQFKIKHRESSEIGYIFSIRNIELLPYGNIIWDLDSAELVMPDNSIIEGPDAVLFFTSAIEYVYSQINKR